MRRPRAVPVLALGAALGVPVGTAFAASPVTQTFSAVGAEQVFTVPGGVRRLTVGVAGAPGGNAFTALGGLGALVRGDLAVTPGQRLYLEVGAQGAPWVFGLSQPSSGSFNGGGAGGFAFENTGADGGGASDIRTVPRAQGAASLASRLVIAAGGGGGGGGGVLAGAGGDAGAPGAFRAGVAPVAQSGAAATATAGGAGGIDVTNGTAGAAGVGGVGGGGSGPHAGGGGGGGGLFGGGGAGGGGNDGSGGGGGSSLAGPALGGATTGTDATRTPRITISYTPVGVLALAGAAAQDLGRIAVGARAGGQVTLGNTGSATVTLSRVAISGPDAAAFTVESAACGAGIPAGGSCALGVVFRPARSGRLAALLDVQADAGAGAVQVGLSGSGVPAAPAGLAARAVGAGIRIVYRAPRAVRVRVQIQRRAGAGWATVRTLALPGGARVRRTISAAGLAPGAYRLRLVALDAARLPSPARTVRVVLPRR